jgi:SAM-dependent methyltransferase
MRLLYGRYYKERDVAVAELIPAGSTVLDLCCGPAVLYRRLLRKKGVDYIGLDLSRFFVDALNKRGVRALVRDLRSNDSLPRADYVVMQSSLCYFLPEPYRVIDRMLEAANKAVIVSEPIRNLSTSKSPLISAIAVKLSGPGGSQPQRFTEETLDKLFGSYSACLKRSFKIPGGREKIYMLEKSVRYSTS